MNSSRLLASGAPRGTWARAWRALRWLLVLAAFGAAYVLGVWVAFVGFEWVMHMCPPEAVVSGACTAAWAATAEAWAMGVGASLAAITWVVLPAWLAPQHRLKVATAAWLLGGGLMGYGFWQLKQLWLAPGLAACVLGTLAWVWFYRREVSAEQRGTSGRGRSGWGAL